MSVNGIGSYNYSSNYIGMNRTAQMRNSQKPTMGNVGSPQTSNITLHYTGVNGDKALTAVGFPDGTSASVYQAENYNDADPEYRVRYWGKSGDDTDTNVRINDVDPENGSYLEMLAYAAYSDVQGYTSDAFGNFLSAAGGVNGDITNDDNSVNVKKNFMNMVRDFMQMQYDNNNLAGYLSFKKFYDYMADGRN